MMCMEKTPWERVCEFHGHICPGLAIGFRATGLALEKMGVARSEDEELVAIVENDACGVDAVQALAGCTFGKGNLFFRDYGKQVYTFARRANEKAVRVSVRYGAFHDPAYGALRARVSAGEATGEEQEQFRDMQQKHIHKILHSGEESFEVKEVDITIPPRARINKSLRCDKCGESVMETRTVNRQGVVLCIPCSL